MGSRKAARPATSDPAASPPPTFEEYLDALPPHARPRLRHGLRMRAVLYLRAHGSTVDVYAEAARLAERAEARDATGRPS